jgi:ubiquinone/menaquinone biosynthesis C-methylase UbiE
LGAPFYPSSHLVVEKMLSLAGVDTGSTVYDLGCGDGEIVVAAAHNHNAKKVVGIERDQRLYFIALKRTRHYSNATIIHANYDDVNISEASVVTLYQSASENARLKPKLLNELSEGTRVVSHDFGIPGWRPATFHTFREGNHSQRVIVYVMGSQEPPLHRGLPPALF